LQQKKIQRLKSKTRELTGMKMMIKPIFYYGNSKHLVMLKLLD
jgi:hypothetical protein